MLQTTTKSVNAFGTDRQALLKPLSDLGKRRRAGWPFYAWETNDAPVHEIPRKDVGTVVASVHHLLVPHRPQPGRSERLVPNENQQFPGSWAPDGELVFTEQRSATGRDILLLPAGGRTPRALLASNADETSPKISPDGRWLASCPTRPDAARCT
jgi:hypothetical protein